MITKKLVWKKKHPPHIGWWQASRFRNPDLWRWWDTKQWSESVSSSSHCMAALVASRYKANEQASIEWTTYWPENARVPRVDTTTNTHAQHYQDFDKALLQEHRWLNTT